MKRTLQILIAFIMILVIAIFGLKDTYIKKTLEKKLTVSLGTKVRIHGVDYSIFKEKLDLYGIGVESLENDAYDIVKIGEVSTKLNYKEIFNKKIKVDRVDIKNICLNVKTERKNIKKPVLNQKQEIVNSDAFELSKEDINKISQLVIKNYDYLIKFSEKDTERFRRSKRIFLTTTTPLIDKYVTYKIEEIGNTYIYEMIKKYRAFSNNIQMSLKEVQNIDWKIEIGSINISTELFGRKFTGTISEFSTDKLKMNQNINFVLDSLNNSETGQILGSINPYTMRGKIQIVLNNANINELKEIKPYASGYLSLNQRLDLDGEQIAIMGNLKLANILLNKEEISEEFLGDKNAIELIQDDSNKKLGDMRVSYSYKPTTRKVEIDNNVVEEIGIYLGADVSQIKMIEKELKLKYGNEIEKVKNDLKSKLNKFFK